MREVLIAAFVIFSSGAVSAQPSAGTGVGAQTCATFVRHLKGNPDFAGTVYGSWAKGFMAGMNMGKPTKKAWRNIAAVSTEAETAQLRDFCDKNPSTLFMEAVIRYYVALPLMPQSN